MPRPRKYKTDADRQSAYRERKNEHDEKMRRELERLKPAKAKRNATIASDDLRPKLRVLRARINRRPKNAARAELVELIDYIKNELDRLLAQAQL